MSITRKEVIEQLRDAVVRIPWHQKSMTVDVSAMWCVLSYLKDPMLPEVPSDAVLKAIEASRFHNPNDIIGNRAVYDAIRAALTTPPKPKMKTVWCVAYTERMNVAGKLTDTDSIARHPTEQDAKDSVQYMRDTDYYISISPIWSEEVEDK